MRSGASSGRLAVAGQIRRRCRCSSDIEILRSSLLTLFNIQTFVGPRRALTWIYVAGPSFVEGVVASWHVLEQFMGLHVANRTGPDTATDDL